MKKSNYRKWWLLPLGMVVCLAGMAQNRLPRANSEARENVISLSGEWQFQRDDQRAGKQEKWYNRTSFNDKIMLPSTIDEQHKGSAEAKQDGRFTRLYAYEGPAWYQRTVDIPAMMEGCSLFLCLERTKVTDVWFDGQYVGSDSSLITTQKFLLTEQAVPGVHRITVRVTNGADENPPVSGCHQMSNGTQTNWNGILGRMEIHAVRDVWLEQVQAYPNLADRNVRLRFHIKKKGQKMEGRMQLELQSWNTKKPHVFETLMLPVVMESNDTVFEYVYPLGDKMQTWDEFSPTLYRVKSTLTTTINGMNVSSVRETDFGMREITSDSQGFVINGRPAFMRGKHDAAVFPHTGYPPMDVDEWIRILKIYKDYGLNHVRCHTWCPPLAAFEAADIVGIYWLPELPHWGAVGGKVDIIQGDVEQKTEIYDNTTSYLVSEGFRMLDEMGSQPSFTMFELGNEMSGSREEMSKIISKFRDHDPRHLYAGGANNFLWAPQFTQGDDFWTTTMTGGTYGAGVYHDTKGLEVRSSYPNHNEGHVNNILCGTDYDYSSAITRFDKPIVSHETGQYQVYPNYNQIEKFTGVTRAYNLDTYRQRLEEAGMGDRAEDFFRASGQLAALCYREDIESAIRTDRFGGFQLLDLQDYPGQGTALVGMLDSYLDSKGIITPEQWREFCCEVVPLLRHKSFTYTTDETFKSRAVIANFGAADLSLKPEWTVSYADGAQIAHGSLARTTMPCGARTDVGSIEFDLSEVKAPCKLTVTLSLPGTSYHNSYSIWVYPRKVDTSVPQGIKVFYSLNSEAQAELERGGKVLILPMSAAIPTSIDGAFQSDFWCYSMFRGYDPPGTLGICLNPQHAAFDQFPTEYHSNWQWWRMLKNGRPINLNTLPQTFRPIVEVIDNVTLNRRLGVMFEAKVGCGQLLVCSMDLQNLQAYPEARQIYASLLGYMASDKFAPTQELTIEQLGTVLTSGVPTETKVTRSIRIDDMNFSVSPAADYKLSGRTVTFDHSNNLFCTVTDGSKGYIKLNDKYARLLIPVMKCASKGSFVSSNTTLHYIDTIGHYRMHVIGDVKFNQTDSTQWIIQLDALDGGVQGIVGLSNTNWGSVLTLTLGDVCLQQTVVAPYIGDVEKSRVPIANMQEPYTGGLFGPSWESLSQYQVPEWFRNAKFGIWAHWGPQCVPEQGDWYARHMYEPGHRHYQYHVEHYGHPSQFGFKDIIHTWKAENWEPNMLMNLYKRVGARYFMAMANHHDNFDLWDSRYHKWNSVDIGPEKNIINVWQKAARAEGLPFGVSVHSSHAWVWYGTARGADTEGGMAGVPYDGNLAVSDGVGTWWEGLDPQELYVQNHEPNPWMSWDWNAGDPSVEYCEDFYNRTVDLINKYQPDIVYFDDTALPLWPASDAGLYVTANYYNSSMQWTGRAPQCVVTGKKLSGIQRRGIVEDIEKGAIDTISAIPWQTCSCLGEYHYRRSYYEDDSYKSAETVVRMLCDIVSKNGNLLLSVPMRGDGTIDDKEESILEGVARWMEVNSECIYDTRPWVVFGEGPDAETPREGRETGTYGADDFRFTVKDDSLYVIVMNRPADGRVRIKSLGTVNGKCDRKFHSLAVLGGGVPEYSREHNALLISLPASDSPIQVVKIVLSKEQLEVKEPFVLRRQNSVEDMVPTSKTFGESYKMTSTSVTFDHSNALISQNTTTNNDYLPVPEGSQKLVLHIDKVSSQGAYNTDNTTLYYVNASGELSSHNYGKIELPSEGNFDFVLPLTPDVLVDGCQGLLSISNSNWSSVLTLDVSEAYFQRGNEVAYCAWGDPTNEDTYERITNLLSRSDLNVLDLSGIEGLDASTDWHALANNPNILIFTNDNKAEQTNEVSKGRCTELYLESGSPSGFYAPCSFTAEHVQVNVPVAEDGQVLILPFDITPSDDVHLYCLTAVTGDSVYCERVWGMAEANSPLVYYSDTEVVLSGSGIVQSSDSDVSSEFFHGTYTPVMVIAGGYKWGTDENGHAGFHLLRTEANLLPFSYILKYEGGPFIPLHLPDVTTHIEDVKNTTHGPAFYDLSGRRVYDNSRGIRVSKGRKYLIK